MRSPLGRVLTAAGNTLANLLAGLDLFRKPARSGDGTFGTQQAQGDERARSRRERYPSD